MKSHIENMVLSIEQSMVERQKMEDSEGMAEVVENKKYNVTGRFDCMQMQYLDMLAEKTKMSRSALVVELTTSALMDIMAKLNLTDQYFDCLVSQKKYDKEGAKCTA